MKPHLLRALGTIAAAALVACGGRGAVPGAAPPAAAFAVAGTGDRGEYRAICSGGTALLPGHSRCFALVRVDRDAHARAACSEAEPGCYGPLALQNAYGVAGAAKRAGKGQTVAIVDAYGYPGVQSDLARYRAHFHLPPCGAGCLTVVNQHGKKSPLPGPNPIPSDDWRPEQALDTDMVSALCPNCRILLVQTNSDANADLAAGVAAAAALHANVISNSYGCREGTCSDSAGNPAYDRPGIAIVASAGDDGAGAEQPCSLATVICVGGTSLRRAADARGYGETVWDGLVHEQCSSGPCATGSGCSAVVLKPAWQHDSGCTRRSESDLSADADPFTGVSVYTSVYQPSLSGGWGGTSASTPMIAAMIALAGNAKTYTPAVLWSHRGKGFNDVVKGTNEAPGITFICPASYAYICNARPGYDGPTGWGTPDGTGSL